MSNGGRTTQGGRGRGRGRSAQSGQPPSQNIFRGMDYSLPTLNFGGSNPRDNKPIEFLLTLGEHVGVKFKSTIAPAFWILPPAFGNYEAEPIIPLAPEGATLSTIEIQEYLHLRKLWLTIKNDTEEQRKAVFCLVYGQLSESSRSEIEDHAEWRTNFQSKNLIYLITRIRATHIAQQSGNSAQDQERVRNLWAHLRMTTHESSYSFRTRVENYQLERLTVGLEELPANELVIGVLNRLDMSRYHRLHSDFLDNARRNIKPFPTAITVLWKDIKETQVSRFRGLTQPPRVEAAFLATTEIARGRGGRGGGGRQSNGGKGGRGRGGRANTSPPPATQNPTTPVPDITCWTCHLPGHRANACPQRTVHFTDASAVPLFLTTIHTFDPAIDDIYPDVNITSDRVFLTKSTTLGPSIILLDTQASVHIVCNPDLLTSIHECESPIYIQGITKDRVHVNVQQ